jgi:hypothetical protein
MFLIVHGWRTTVVDYLLCSGLPSALAKHPGQRHAVLPKRPPFRLLRIHRVSHPRQCRRTVLPLTRSIPIQLNHLGPTDTPCHLLITSTQSSVGVPQLVQTSLLYLPSHLRWFVTMQTRAPRLVPEVKVLQFLYEVLGLGTTRCALSRHFVGVRVKPPQRLATGCVGEEVNYMSHRFSLPFLAASGGLGCVFDLFPYCPASLKSFGPPSPSPAGE